MQMKEALFLVLFLVPLCSTMKRVYIDDSVHTINTNSGDNYFYMDLFYATIFDVNSISNLFNFEFNSVFLFFSNDICFSNSSTFFVNSLFLVFSSLNPFLRTSIFINKSLTNGSSINFCILGSRLLFGLFFLFCEASVDDIFLFLIHL